MSSRFSDVACTNPSPQSPPDTVEIYLEELGEHSAVRALFNTLTGSYGSAQFRFVARGPGDHDADEHIAVGDTFPVMRFQDLDDRTYPNAWIDTVVERLRALDVKLSDMGWARNDRKGDHWWSLTYHRPPSRR